MQEIDAGQAHAEYGAWLLQGEQIQSAYRMVRDGFCITDQRVITLDHQGATGKKTRVKSISLASIVDVTAETAGAMDDSEITIVYISTPRRAAPQVAYDSYTFEFPRNFDIAALYRYFMSIAAHNVHELNRTS